MAKPVKPKIGAAQSDSEYIDKLLYLSRASWEELPEVEAEIDGWDLMDQLTYTEEWPLEKDRLRRLDLYFKQGLMTEDQRSRYEELRKLVAQNRPIIERILRG